MRKTQGILLSLPGFLLILGVLIVPVGFSIYVSMYDANYMQLNKFVGLDNYRRVLSNRLILMDFVRTFYVSFLSLVISMGLGTMLALWINSKKTFFLPYFLQMTGLIPWVTSMIVAALLWKWLLDYELGIVNYLFQLLGLNKQSILTNTATSIYGVIFVISWRTLGYAMVMILAGLKAIPLQLEEAAAIDGCGRWKILRYIRLPMIKTQLLISSIVLTMSNFNNFVVPNALTGGGPARASNVITITMYKEGFTYARYGISSSITMLILLINILLVILYVRSVKYDV